MDGSRGVVTDEARGSLCRCGFRCGSWGIDVLVKRVMCPCRCVVLCCVLSWRECTHHFLTGGSSFRLISFFFSLRKRQSGFTFVSGISLWSFPSAAVKRYTSCAVCARVCLFGACWGEGSSFLNAQPRCCFFLFWIFPLSRLRFYGGAYELWPTGIFDFPSPLPRHSSSLVDESKISSTFGVSLFFAFAFCGCWFSLAAVWWRRRRRRRWIVTSYFWLFRMMLLPFFGSILLDSHSLQTTVKHARASPFQK